MRTSDETIAQIAKDLGISDQTLRNWVKQDDGLNPSRKLSTEAGQVQSRSCHPVGLRQVTS